MKAPLKVIAALGLAGVSLAACGSSKTATVTETFANGQKVQVPVDQVPTTTTTLVPPPNAPVGFNASKTYFVLPHHLGLLPAPELALAKADPTYAAGLANLGDWQEWPTQVLVDPSHYGGLEFTPGAKIKTVDMWYYLGSYAAQPASAMNDGLGNIKIAIVTENEDGYPFVTPVLHSTSVRVNDSTLHNINWGSGVIHIPAPITAKLVAPSTLEDQAAPIGTLAVKGQTLPAFCVPVPEAYISSGGKVVTSPANTPAITAGPSTVFANPPATSAKSSLAMYDQGVSSCAAFH